MRPGGALAAHVACVALSLPSLANAHPCEGVVWELHDTLRELIETRLGRGGMLGAVEVEAALRRRDLPFVAPVFRFARQGGAEPFSAPVPPTALRPCDARFPREARGHAVEGASPSAFLQVDAPVLSLEVEPVESGPQVRVRARLAEGVSASRAAIVVGGLEGAARSYAVDFVGPLADVRLPAAELPATAIVQLVVDTAFGPEVVGERWLGDHEAVSRLRSGGAAARGVAGAAPSAPSGAESARAFEERLTAARRALGAEPLKEHPGLARVAERTLAASLARGVLVHRSGAGLVDKRLQDAHIRNRGSGELLARLAPGEDAAARFFASPAHRLVVGNAAFRAVGIARRPGPDGLIWVVVVLADLP